ncbi:hypothetical protein GS399_10020 [Pedobacter sp. HMF7647]|uniref:Sugar transporter n=1 Tax=Hufsiella arboris TaxID=2695275 RepID=A0A7K1Y9Q2_9SPHI|nr:polysaccharide biosynthesis/export family protein [Hufsiella arboris]MXV51304.1 hypothetical protein [Hufsiella arboris]
MKTTTRLLTAIVLLNIISILLSSCSTKRLKYFQDIPNTYSANKIELSNFTDPVIKPDDILIININTTDPAATVSINSRNGTYINNSSNLGSGSANPLLGYLVDKEGFVEIPIIGKLKMSGLTTAQAKTTIREKAVKSFNDPVIDVRFSNFKISVLGEVNRPAMYVMPNEQNTVLDAISYAGDMTFYGDRHNVLLIRKGLDGNNLTVKFDMTKKESLASPYFYLRQNDVIYVEPTKTKVLNNDNNVVKYLTLLATLVTATVVTLNYANK